MQHEAFVSGNFDTKFIDKYFKPEALAHSANYTEIAAIAASTVFSAKRNKRVTDTKIQNTEGANWKKNRKSF